MKKIIVSLFLTTLLGCFSKEIIVNSDFLGDLASEDNRIAGQLFLDVYNKDLDTLTFDYYINYLKGNETPAAQGLYLKILKAKEHYFKTKKNAFLLVLYFENEKCIVCDNSSTGLIDSTRFYKPNEIIPNVKTFSEKIKF
jgi:hypothetical protein